MLSHVGQTSQTNRLKYNTADKHTVVEGVTLAEFRHLVLIIMYLLTYICHVIVTVGD